MKKIIDKKDQFFALIPARKGSLGVKNKNVVKINNKRLIDYTLLQASKSKIIDQIYVSSNDHRVLKITKRYKKIQFIKRKDNLSGSKVLMKDVILDFLNFIGKSFDLKKINLIILQPTSPQREAIDIDKAIRLFKKKKNFPLLSFSEPISNPNNVVYLDKKRLFPFRKSFTSKNRQDYKKNLYINGSIYIVNAKKYLKDPNLLTSNSTVYEMDKKHSIQIDDYFDLKIIKSFIK
jgi:CMP-N,N'-diacetyllegionaminic acid synthase